MLQTADVEKDLTEMHVPASLIVDLVKVVKSCRARFETTAIQRRISFPTVDLLKVYNPLDSSSRAMLGPTTTITTTALLLKGC